MIGVIEVRDLRFSAVVGVLAHERVQAQPLALDLDLERAFDDVVVSDEVADTTNYADVITLAAAVATDGKFFLLETLADRVARAILDYDTSLLAVTVGIRKRRPPVASDVASVGVRLTVRRG